TNAAGPGASPAELSASDSEPPPFIEVSESGSVKISRAVSAAPAPEGADVTDQPTVAAVEPRLNAVENGATVTAEAAVPPPIDLLVVPTGGQTESPAAHPISAAFDG